LRGALDDGRLFGGIDRAEDDAVGFQGDRLVERGGPLLDRALAVQDAEIPPHHLGRLLRAIADALGSAIALVGRDVDDELLALCLRAGGGTGPSRAGRRHLGDIRLRLHQISIVGARGDAVQRHGRDGDQQAPRIDPIA
jgi:hypothetical protein